MGPSWNSTLSQELPHCSPQDEKLEAKQSLDLEIFGIFMNLLCVRKCPEFLPIPTSPRQGMFDGVCIQVNVLWRPTGEIPGTQLVAAEIAPEGFDALGLRKGRDMCTLQR